VESRFVRVTHGDEAEMNRQLEVLGADGWQLDDAFAAAGDVVLLFSRTKPAADAPPPAEGA
jgi:hypothetical protein